MKLLFFRITYIFLLLFFLWQCVIGPVLNEYMPFVGPVRTDVAKRIESPDSSKTAILIRRQAFDLNFYVDIKKGLRTRKLHRSRDFYPNSQLDFNEKIVWSNDSNLLVLMIDDVSGNNEKYMWAYDFRDKKEYYDNDKITEMMLEKKIEVVNCPSKE